VEQQAVVKGCAMEQQAVKVRLFVFWQEERALFLFYSNILLILK
jgi:hypothetical protein